MSNIISTFNFKSQPVRVQSINNEPYFCLSDVCVVLNVNRRSAEAFRLNEKGCNKIATLTSGGEQEITFINEPNLYRIIFRSNKTEAVDFQNWVFEEVLPQIRKTGRYEQQQQLALPEPPRERTYTHTLKESFWRNLAWLWYEAHQENELIARVLPGLEAIASKHAPTAYSQKVEYGNHIRFMADQIYSLVKDIPFEHSYAPLRALEAVMQTKQTKRIYR